MSASSANMRTLSVIKENRIVLSVMSPRKKMSCMLLQAKRMAKNPATGASSRIGAKYMPVLAMSWMNLAVS